MSSPAFDERVLGRIRPAQESANALSFTGTTAEYFRIWIVNIALTTVTLGLYWAWAKVRTRQYFYGNTWLGEHNFEYTARPVAILRGHLIVAAMAGLYSFLQSYDVGLWLIVVALFTTIWPYLAWSSLRFLAANTAHRGLKFGFHGKLGEAYKVYLAWPLLLIPTFGILLPYITYLQRRYTFDHAAYGASRTYFTGKSGDVWIIYLLAFAFSIVASTVFSVVLFVFGVFAAMFGSLDDFDMDRLSEPGFYVIIGLGYGMMLLVFSGIGAYVKASLLNFVLANTHLDGGANSNDLVFQSRIEPWRYTLISITNTLAQVFTLGLATPWAAIRRASYVLPRIAVFAPLGLEAFSADVAQRQDALGEAATDFLGLDIGL